MSGARASENGFVDTISSVLPHSPHSRISLGRTVSANSTLPSQLGHNCMTIKASFGIRLEVQLTFFRRHRAQPVGRNPDSSGHLGRGVVVSHRERRRETAAVAVQDKADTAVSGESPTDTRPLLRQRDFLALLSGETISQLGSQITLFAIPMLAVLVLGAS